MAMMVEVLVLVVMGFMMRNNSKLKKYMFYFWLFNVLFIINQKNIYAAEESLENNKAIMRNGAVYYQTQDTTATTSTTWRTEGFTVKRDKTKGDPTKKPKGELMLKNGEKRTVVNGAITTTTFTFPEANVRKEFDKAKINAESLEKSGGYVYLNGIFRVYFSGKPRNVYYKTLKGIMYPSGVYWKNPNDFKDHFDIELEYMPSASPQPVYLTIMKYSSKGYTKVQRKKIAEINENEKFKLKTSDVPGTIISDVTGNTLYLCRTNWAKWSDKEVKHSNGTYRKMRDPVRTNENPKENWEAYKASLQPVRNRKFNVINKGIEIICIYKNPSPNKEETTDIKEDIIEPTVEAVIQADTRGNEQFDSKEGIPTTENQYVNVITSQYLTQYRFKNYKGTKNYMQKIPGEMGEDGVQKPDTFKSVSRNYSYWKIIDLNVYKLSKAEVENYSLPGTTVTVPASSSYKPPSVSYKVYSDNMKEPESGVEDVGEIEVRNDKVIFNGATIMDGSWQQSSTSTPSRLPVAGNIDNNALFKSGLTIDALKANGEYESAASAIYTRICHYGSDSEGNETAFDAEDVNDVIIHTPAICDGYVQDVKEFNQLLTPDRSMAGLILDRDFSVTVPSAGFHSDLKGYGYRDYSKYTAKKEVRFPFDVYQGTTYYKADTWITMNSNTARFYLPIWADENMYAVEFRARTINCDANDGLELAEELANTDYSNYVATDVSEVEVSGRIYGMNLYDISDYPIWESVFRKQNSLSLSGFKYTVGTNNQNGEATGKNSRHTFTLVNGSHPFLNNIGVIKTGYVARFNLTTIGNMYSDEDYVNLKPSFYYIDSAGNREEADVYYTETIDGKQQNLVKVGGRQDDANKKAMRLGNLHTGVSAQELDIKAAVTGKTVKELKADKANVYTFSNIMIPEKLRTYTGKNYTPTGTVPAGVDPDKVTKSMQKWYFEYYLPSEIHIVKKGFDVLGYAKENYGLDYKEDFWKKDGYLLINFDIETIQGNREGGRRHLSYQNLDNAADGYCNMWKLEGFQYTKQDHRGKTLKFTDGDSILYYLNKSAGRDYTSSGTH